MKKILSILILMMLLVCIPKTYAIETAETNILDEMQWTLHSAFNRYYLQSNVKAIEYDNLYLELNTTLHEGESFPEIPFMVDGTYSNVAIYLTPSSTIATQQYWFGYEEENPESELMLLNKSSVNVYAESVLNIGDYKGMYMRVRIQLSSELTSSERSRILYTLNSDDAEYILDWNFRATNDIDDTMTLLDLPETTGSPFMESSLMEVVDESYYGLVDFSYIGGDFTIQLQYFGTYVYMIEDITFEDDSFLDNVENAYYYTVDDDRYLYFAYGEYDNFVLTDGDVLSKPWSGFTIWNLTTNEIITTQRVWSLTYIEVVDLNAYAYFYMPTVPMEDLITVSTTFDYRLGKKGPTTFWSQKYLPWETKTLLLEKDAESLESYPQWVYDTYVYSAAAMGVGAVVSLFQPLVGLPLLLGGSIGAMVAVGGVAYEMIVDNIDQIQKINYPSTSLVTTINEHYSELSGIDIDVTGSTLYKLHLGEFSGVDINYIEFDQDNFKYTEIVWVTNGTVYSVQEDYIDNEVIVDQDYVAERPEETETPNIMNFIMMPLVVILFVIIAFRMKAFSDIKSVAILIGLMFLTLLLLGVI